MWEMLDSDIQCDACGGAGAPPIFMVPPPPRPPFIQELTKCSEEDGWLDYDMCEAIPILDASYHSSPSLQTSAMIAVFSLLLVLVVLISSLFVWKHKRKVQNFLPCKTPTRGGHLSGGVPGGHSVTYEDPDAHLGHRPLVMRHHHNVELLHPKSIHYPSGYPMTRSPPLFVCSSPGPDPYRSNDNVYEELGPGRDSDGESEPPLHSDDDFAEDELSLPGDRSFQKSDGPPIPVATIYHERINGNSGHERNSLISSSSSSNATTDQRNGVMAGLVRPLTASSGRKAHHHHNSSSSTYNGNKSNATRKQNNSNNYSTTTDELNTSSEQTTGSDIVSSVYDDRNLMSLTFNSHQHHQHHSNNPLSNSNSNNNNNNNLNNSNNNSTSTNSNRMHCFTKSNPGLLLDSEVERRNRINNQLHHPPVSTIFRERNNYNNTIARHQQYPQPYYTQHSLLGNHQQQHRSRTNPRSLDRRRIAVPIDHEPAYGYAEPVFHEGLLYDACLAHPNASTTPFRTHPYPYILPEFTTFRTLGNGVQHYHHPQQQQQQQQQQGHSQDLLQPPSHQIYSRDSSFGSDSGYSQHTQLSGGAGSGGIGRADSVSVSNTNSTESASCGRPNSIATGTSTGAGGGITTGKIGLNFAWNRRTAKDNSNSTTTATAPPSATTIATTTNNTSSSSNNSNNNNNTNISSSCNNSKSKTFEDS